MSRLHQEWTIPPHGPVEQLAEGVLTVAGELRMPLGTFPRRMTAVALDGGRSAIWSAMPLNDAGMARIEALGEPAVLIVPGIAHRLDAPAWLKRYPQMKVLCPPGARTRVEQAVPVDDTLGASLADGEVGFEVVSGTGGREAALWVRRGRDLTLVVNDILGNVRHPPGPMGWIMARLLGFGVDRPQVPRTGRAMLVKDSLALAGALWRWSSERDLRRIVVSHGEVITRDPRGELQRIAAGLV